MTPVNHKKIKMLLQVLTLSENKFMQMTIENKQAIGNLKQAKTPISTFLKDKQKVWVASVTHSTKKALTAKNENPQF